MKKLLYIFLFIIVAGSMLCAADIRNNLLKNEDFFSPLGLTFVPNNNWTGFNDLVPEADNPNTNSGHFVREIISETKMQCFFARPYELRQKEESVSISNRPTLLNHIADVTVKQGQVYEVGFKLCAYDILFDPSLTEYGFSCQIDWYDKSSQYIGTSRDKANIDSTEIYGASEKLTHEWITYKSFVKAPANSKYFTFRIVADKGVYTSEGDKIEIAAPFMYEATTDCLSLSIDPGSDEIAVFNNTFIKAKIDGFPQLQFGFKLNAYVNFDANSMLADYKNYQSINNLKDAFTINIYKPTSPEIKYNSVVGNITVFNGYNPEYKKLTAPVNWNLLEPGKYIAEVIFHDIEDLSKVISRKKIEFTVTQNMYKGSVFGPLGYESGAYNTKMRYWLKPNGISEFMLGLVDRGVNYKYLDVDPVTGWGYGINNEESTIMGNDLVGSTLATFFTPIPSSFADYLNLVYPTVENSPYFSYYACEKLGLNAVYPVFIARIPSFNVFGMLEALRQVGNVGSHINIFFPYQEFARNKYSRELQYKMTNEKGLYSSDIYGSDNSFTQFAKAVKGSANIIGYVLNDDLNIGGIDETMDKKHQMNAIDPTRATCSFIDADKGFINGGNNELIPMTEINEAGDVLFVNIKPKNNVWTNEELNKLKNDTYNLIKPFVMNNKSIMINIAIRKKNEGNNIIPLSISDMTEIYGAFKNADEHIAGIFYDSVSDMTVQKKDVVDVPAFHYNLFKLFLKERDNSNYHNTTDITDENVIKNIKANFKVNGNNLDDVFKEIHIKQIGENQYECFFYYNNISDSVRNLNFAPNEYFRQASSPVLYYMSGQDEFNSEESIAFAENTTHFNLSIDKNTIVGFKLLLNYVPIPPVVTIIPE